MWKTMDVNFKYKIVRNIIPKELSNFLYQYWIIQEQAVKDMLINHETYKHNVFIGNFELDTQCVGHYAKYGDWAADTLLEFVRPKVEEELKIKLVPTYSYTRIYRTGAFLSRHIDRSSCRISATINLGGDEWPIFLDPTGKRSVIKTWNDEKGEQVKLKKNFPKGKQIDLKPGDALFYAGDKLEHWREPFTKDHCVQTFLHYNEDNVEGRKNKYDTRNYLGQPRFTDD
jgi:hypothetical protein